MKHERPSLESSKKSTVGDEVLKSAIRRVKSAQLQKPAKTSQTPKTQEQIYTKSEVQKQWSNEKKTV